jgi:hypothetical protein
MTIAELIAQLKDLDQTKIVCFDGPGNYVPAESIYQLTLVPCATDGTLDQGLEELDSSDQDDTYEAVIISYLPPSKSG